MSNLDSQAMSMLDEPTLLAQRSGLRRLRFNAELEEDFAGYMHVRLANRAFVVAVCAFTFMLLFMLLDWAYLTVELYQVTIPARMAVLLVVGWAIWYSGRPAKVAPDQAFAVSILGYTLSGLMVALVIVAARQVDLPVAVTHEGLYLVLLAGFFLLGLPTRHAVLGSWIIVAVYLLAEYAAGAPRSVIFANGLYLSCFTVIGTFGAYLYEYMLRYGFLNEGLMQAAQRRAERESQSKTRFLATSSHDLRQPLHAMTLFIENLDGRITDMETRKTLKRLADSAHVLQDMLNALLDISRLSVGMVQPQLQSINLHPWLSRLLASMESSARAKGVELQLLCPPRVAVQSDPVLLERLVRNFLNNALVHARATEVRVEVSRADDRLRLAIADDGCGMTEADQLRIFEEFTQLANPARSLDKGVGLGLSICRQLLHLLTYPSGVVSAPGQGSRFWFEVPQAEWRDQPASTARQLQPGLQGKVAVVDNDEINREAMQGLLVQWGLEVVSYASAEEVMIALESAGADVLLSDYRLEGELNGLELVRQLRTSKRFSGPAVLVTADTREEVAEQARLVDVHVLYKPVLPSRLRRHLQTLLRNSVRS
ncbi:hybrid sensor histidine kinase/response regulator [Halopseudomonas salegens]|uniref:histidine kinase n=1 Tax=Halopseudomonas salegens TaxID=1434072 RepID=A0A1H2FVM1_9GAMM|nr:hybrid sensor histidine kinase/response regulator [Halopseudomonas salegens]SDU11379.1 Signal transduction histidine kinase [Halopseudomonas salegens]